MKIIANIGYNWWAKSESRKRGEELVDVAAAAGVSGVCIPYTRAKTLYRNDELVKQFQKFDIPPELFYDLCQRVRDAGLELWASPRHEDDVDYLDKVGVSNYHVQNGDTKYKPLLQRLAVGKPVLLSTAYATFEEIDDAATILLNGQAPSESELVLLHSTGSYPTSASEAQLTRILDIATEFFPLYVGLESFYVNSILDYVAMAFKPAVIMRRLDLADSKGIEAPYSIDPKQMRELVDVSVAMYNVNNPEFYVGDLVQGDFDARAAQLRCEDGDYLLPPHG